MMKDFGFTMKVKDMFFDRAVVYNQLDGKTRNALSRAGAFIRRAAQSLMRPGGKKKAIARPGEPPRTHRGDLRRYIFFAYDPAAKSVVIGPLLFNGNPYRGVTVPQVLEFGANVTRKDKPGRTLHYSGNPYMAPALRQEMPKLPSCWQAQVGT